MKEWAHEWRMTKIVEQRKNEWMKQSMDSGMNERINE